MKKKSGKLTAVLLVSMFAAVSLPLRFVTKVQAQVAEFAPNKLGTEKPYYISQNNEYLNPITGFRILTLDSPVSNPDPGWTLVSTDLNNSTLFKLTVFSITRYVFSITHIL